MLQATTASATACRATSSTSAPTTAAARRRAVVRRPERVSTRSSPSGSRRTRTPRRWSLAAFLKFNQPVGPRARLAPAIASTSATGTTSSASSSRPSTTRPRSATAIAYKLEGFDPRLDRPRQPAPRDLHQPRRRAATRLRVRAANSDGVWNEEGPGARLARGAAALAPAVGLRAYVPGRRGAAARRSSASQQRKVAREAEYRRRLELEVQDRTQELGQRNTELEQVNDAARRDQPDRLADRPAQPALPLRAGRPRRWARCSGSTRGSRSGHAQDAQQLIVHDDRPRLVQADQRHLRPRRRRRVLLQVRRASWRRPAARSDVLIRWGGDEFLVVGRASDLEGFEVVPERIRAMIEQTPLRPGRRPGGSHHLLDRLHRLPRRVWRRRRASRSIRSLASRTRPFTPPSGPAATPGSASWPRRTRTSSSCRGRASPTRTRCIRPVSTCGARPRTGDPAPPCHQPSGQRR